MVALYGEILGPRLPWFQSLTSSTGVGQTSVGPMVVEELVKTYLDVLYE